MTHINQRRDTSANWTAENPVLELGEVGWETDSLKAKIGNGVTPWTGLAYAVDFSPYALITQSIADGDTTHSPSADVVFDVLGAMITQSITDGDITHVPSADAVSDFIAALIVQDIANGDTTHVPSADAVFDFTPTYLTATATLDFPLIAAQTATAITFQSLTIALPGAVVNDAVLLGPPSTIDAGLIWEGYVSAADVVTLRLGNATAVDINPASATWRVAVVQ